MITRLLDRVFDDIAPVQVFLVGWCFSAFVFAVSLSAGGLYLHLAATGFLAATVIADVIQRWRANVKSD